MGFITASEYLLRNDLKNCGQHFFFILSILHWEDHLLWIETSKYNVFVFWGFFWWQCWCGFEWVSVYIFIIYLFILTQIAHILPHFLYSHWNVSRLIDIMQLWIFFMSSLEKKCTVLRQTQLIKSLLLHIVHYSV